jgi:hypothetical protein
MVKRARYRRTRRNRKTRYRKPRFNNRTKKNTITPTLQSKLNNVVREIDFSYNILNVTEINIQGKSFNPDNVNGNLENWEDIRKAVYLRDGYKCQVCKGKSKDFQLEAHHIIPRSENGSHELDNLVTVCKTCHIKITNGEIDAKGKRLKKFKFNNTTQRLHILKLLKEHYPAINFKYGSEISKLRYKNNIDYSLLNDSVLLCNCIKLSNFFYKKRILSKHDYQQTKGIRSEKKIPTGKLSGFRKFDKVKYNGEYYWIKGRRTTGYFDLMDFEGNSVNLKPIPKVSKIQRVGARKSWIITEKTIVNIC